MKHLTLTQSNYTSNYRPLQLSLPIDLGIKIDSNDMVVSFQEAIEGVNLGKYLKKEERRGRKGHDKVMLLKVLLFGYMENNRNLRALEKACACDIRYMWLSNEETPSFMAFERLIKDYLIKSIDEIYFDIVLKLVDIMDIDMSKIYIDGTKIEANANKYTFVYKKRIVNSRIKLYERITDSIISLNMNYGYTYPHKKEYCAQEIGYIAQYLMEVMINNDIELVYGKGKRKTKIQCEYDLFMDYYAKLNEYEHWLHIIGDERNSCSKTDHDATMCATKLDYYCNTGLSRPCYNVQIGVSDGLIINSDIYQRAGDTKTFIPFMERYKKYIGALPLFPVADAAYGTYDNYMYCLENNINFSMKYNYYAKKNEKSFKKQLFNTMNWEENEKGHKICPMNHLFDQYKADQVDETGEYLKISQLWESKETCSDCPHKNNCYKANKEKRTISRNVILEEFHLEVDKILGTEEGEELKKQRSIQAEGAFGVLKQNMNFTRFTRKGKENVKMELLLICLGYNLRKYHQYRMNNLTFDIN